MRRCEPPMCHQLQCIVRVTSTTTITHHPWERLLPPSRTPHPPHPHSLHSLIITETCMVVVVVVGLPALSHQCHTPSHPTTATCPGIRTPTPFSTPMSPCARCSSIIANTERCLGCIMLMLMLMLLWVALLPLSVGVVVVVALGLGLASTPLEVLMGPSPLH